MNNYKTITEYIENFPQEIKTKLEEMRKVIKNAAPNSTETIKYGIPTFQLNGKNLVHFGGYKNHIGFYPTPNGLQEFEKELEPYLTGKGTAQFPLDKQLPTSLITKIVKFRAIQTLENIKK